MEARGTPNTHQSFKMSSTNLDFRQPTININDLVNQLEEPRINTCSMYAYTIDENSDIAILMRCKKTDSKQCGMYQDFGTTLRENEPNILFSAARSFIAKSAGLFVPSERANIAQPLEIKQIVKDSVSRSQIDIYTNSKVREVLNEFN